MRDYSARAAAGSNGAAAAAAAEAMRVDRERADRERADRERAAARGVPYTPPPGSPAVADAAAVPDGAFGPLPAPDGVSPLPVGPDGLDFWSAGAPRGGGDGGGAPNPFAGPGGPNPFMVPDGAPLGAPWDGPDALRAAAKSEREEQEAMGSN